MILEKSLTTGILTGVFMTDSILYSGQFTCVVCGERKPISEFVKYNECRDCFSREDYNVKYEVKECSIADFVRILNETTDKRD